MTAAVPEVVEAVKGLTIREIILDGEVLALQRDGTPLPFQETMRRFGRRLEIDRLRTELPLTPFFFDCLYTDGRSLTGTPQRDRFATLTEAAGKLAVPHRIISDPAAASEFFDKAIAMGHEGLMAKSLDSPYAAGSRGSAWLKSSASARSIWLCWQPSGAAGDEKGGSATFISARAIPVETVSSCWARPSKA